ncbi:NmrA-like family domain-containing protein 1 [Vanrija pseudolonga]|uniref:NmrA-like family domain-containing protein 1 n=1 Tax=Vanrija pseudolonga TaxID=143232 RepID=A0AAF0YE55_9TREE|nr:NmrA-like family domain-containing protein 1 [Vanrija pseudolonga]
MASRKIVVFGVTGIQGASVAKALLADTENKWDVVGITRDPASKGSKAVADLGVTLAQGDLDDPASYAPALAGAYGAFINANFWANYKGDAAPAKATEIRQCSGAVDAALAAGVKHIVYSALESFAPAQELPHFDSKAEVVAYLKKLNAPATPLYTAYYYSNVFMSAKGAVLDLPIPEDAVIPAFDAGQIGLWARAAFRDPAKWIGKDMYAAGENITAKQIAAVLSQVAGHEVRPLNYTREQFLELDKNGALDHEIWLNYLAIVEDRWHRDVKASREIAPDAWDFKTWAENNAAAIKEHFVAA